MVVLTKIIILPKIKVINKIKVLTKIMALTIIVTITIVINHHIINEIIITTMIGSGVAIGAKPAAPDKQRAAAAAVAAPITAPLGRRMTTSATKPRGASAREATIPRGEPREKEESLNKKNQTL